MTVDAIKRYFSDRGFLPNPDQEVRFVLADDGTPIEAGQRLEMRGTTVPETGDVVVALRPATKRKFMFSLKFESNPVIEAHTLEEAEKLAYEWMRHRAVVDTCTGDGDPDYVAQEPYFLEEVKE